MGRWVSDKEYWEDDVLGYPSPRAEITRSELGYTAIFFLCVGLGIGFVVGLSISVIYF